MRLSKEQLFQVESAVHAGVGFRQAIRRELPGIGAADMAREISRVEAAMVGRYSPGPRAAWWTAFLAEVNAAVRRLVNRKRPGEYPSARLIRLAYLQNLERYNQSQDCGGGGRNRGCAGPSSPRCQNQTRSVSGCESEPKFSAGSWFSLAASKTETAKIGKQRRAA